MSVTIQEQMEELKRRIALVDGDRNAYAESSQWAIKQNKELISRLRAENKALRARLSRKMTADDDVISEVFQAHNARTPAELKGMEGETAVRKFDQTVCELIKRRNALQHLKRSREQMLASLEVQLAQMKVDSQTSAASPDDDSEDARLHRQLENRLDKAVIKCNEAKHIRKTYELILEKLQDERLEFDNELAGVEKNIKKRRSDLRELQSMFTDAQLSRDMAKAELTHQEQSMAESRREREKVITEYRRQADEKKEFAEKVDRRLRRISQHGSAGQLDAMVDTSGQDQEERIFSFEEALAKIKDTTGVSDIQEVVDRFLNQGDTKRHLEQLREDHSEQLARLREERDRLGDKFEELKYSGEAKMSAGQRMLEEFQTHLDTAKNKSAESEDRADRASRLLAQVKNGVDHLHEKLQHIKAPHTHTLKPRLAPGSEELVLELLSTAEGKLVALAEELASRDLDTVRREMEDEEFRHTVEGGTAANVRVEIPVEGSQSAFYDEGSGSEEEFVSRESMKKATMQLMEARTKKKHQDEEEEEGGGKKRRRR